MARNQPAPEPEPLGSLTRRGARDGATCRLCGSERVTRIGMELTDGSEVQFTSCLDCEHRTWEQGEDLLSVDRVLAKTQRTR